MFKTIELKLYPTDAQAATMAEWLRTCCWLYNRALEQRTKAYKRRKESITYNAQTAWLTRLRKHKPPVEAVPVPFARHSAMKRVERAFQAFFRRCKAGERPGYPRFKSARRFDTMECCQPGRYVRNGNMVAVPKLGLVRCRGGNRTIPAEQRLLRIIRRDTTWYAQVLIDDGKPAPAKREVRDSVGIDVGLTDFATLSNGEKIDNPRWSRRSYRKLRALQRRVSRRAKGSKRRRKAVCRLRRHHERVARQRRAFCHQTARRLVEKYDLIAIEKLNIRGMARSRLARSVLDAGWNQFATIITHKAEEAGAQVVMVNPSGTSQDCANCGVRVPKSLSERVHRCTACGFQCDRDHNAAMNILSRALGVAGARQTLAEESTTGAGLVCRHQADPVKREGSE